MMMMMMMNIIIGGWLLKPYSFGVRSTLAT